MVNSGCWFGVQPVVVRAVTRARLYGVAASLLILALVPWAHDREGLERLSNYGARGPLSLERLSLLPDGRVSHRMKRPAASGATELVLSPVAFLRRLAALVPPPGVHLVRFFGVLAPNARLRPLVVPRPPAPAEPPPATELPTTARPARIP